MPHFPMNTGTLVERKATANEKQTEQLPDEPQRAAHPPSSVQVKNRRKRYLDTHPEYFGPDLELAG
jgi:hypothetical protein